MRVKIASPDQFQLNRYPPTQDKSLRAWSAADELLIEHLNEHARQPERTLIINDQFGALSVCLNDWSPQYWSDSFLANRATELNLRKNFEQQARARPFPFQFAEQQFAVDEKHEPVTHLILRVPKHNSLLEFQLNQVKPLLADNAHIVAAGMTRDIHKSNLKIFESVLGTTQTSLAKKKARLIFSQLENDGCQPVKTTRYLLHKENLTLVGLPGVFCREKLDIGTRVLLDYLPEISENAKVIDLGCGNGVLGATLAKRHPGARILLTDESALAVESARQTFKANGLANGTFIQTDGLQGIEENNFDYIVCNPPFHQQNVQTLAIAHKMFKQAAQKLSDAGELRVVANRHLKYQTHLKQLFLKVQSISSDSKFSVWQAQYPKGRN